jgi:transcriptional regulator with XRE-family HTH domain
MMTFGNYLKMFRKRYGFTQEQLVEALYHFDDLFFSGLDATTLSKWERSITRPKAAKQSRILQFAQFHSGEPLPIFSDMSYDELRTEICHKGLEGILQGRISDIILNMQTTIMHLHTLHIITTKSTPQNATLLELAADLRNEAHPQMTQVTLKNLETWQHHEGNMFWYSNYKDVTTGMLFSLRLKPDTYRELILFERPLHTVTSEEFASLQEPGCYYSFVYYALNEVSALVLMQYFYLEMVYRQHHIRRVGASVARNDAHKIVRRMEHRAVEIFRDGAYEVTSYDTSVTSLLSSEYFVKSVFVPDGCEET